MKEYFNSMNTMPTLSVALAGATLVSLTIFSSAQAAQVTLSNYEIPENLILYDTSGTFDSPNIFFNEPTDTIQISGQTVLGEESTYEARIYFPTNGGAAGRVFNEWKGSLEDKTLYAGPGGLAGFNWPLYPGVVLVRGLMAHLHPASLSPRPKNPSPSPNPLLHWVY